MHLLDIHDVNIETVKKLFTRAEFFCANKTTLTNTNKTIALLFFEPSTRTRCSFEIAAKTLGMTVIHLDMAQSSVVKGEDVVDTIKNLAAMGVDGFVIRHKNADTIKFLSNYINKPIINAGAGTSSHPTQALLDVFTILQHKSDLEKLTIAIVGDILHSRVAQSNIALMQLLGVKNICLVGPENFLPIADKNISIHTDLAQGIKNCDVVMVLRIQQERMQTIEIPDFASYHQHYGLKQQHLSLLAKDAIVLHPGPINRGVEIESAVADGAQSVILQQVANGVLIRMAVLEWLIG